MKVYYGYWNPTWCRPNGKAASVKAKSAVEAIEKLYTLGYGKPNEVVGA